MKGKTLTALVLAGVFGACDPPQEGAQTADNQPPPPPPQGYYGQPPQGYYAQPQPTVPVAPPLPPPPTEQECRARAASAPPIDTTGATDVRQQFGKVFEAHHETFRCCFDALEAPSKPRTGAKISMLMKVDEAGKLTSAEVLAAESDPISPQTSKCLTDIAAMIPYPRPMSGAPVGYHRLFDFKPRR